MLTAGFNLASSDYRRSRRTTLLLGGLVAGLIVLLVTQLVGWFILGREDSSGARRLESMETQVRRHQEEIRSIRANIPADATKKYEAKVAAYNQILEASAFSWIGLLVELEHSVPPGVFLAEIHPDLGTGKVSLRGTARSFDELTKFLTGLEQRTRFRDVYLLRQTSKKPTGGGPDVLEFSVTFLYQGRAQ